ncbi:MAG: hypothetical protein GX597_11345 [Anaerolineaceae bacterium]|jgi:hypothetical protein|nr:hypothetical protein [Anaerolineae bacterium]MDX9830445.1 hypothetical protein [Anaerolineae bacterium]NLF12370.1 hypothetical protein [Anaerolineaceae bacterium]
MGRYEYLRLSPYSTSRTHTFLTIVTSDAYVADYVIALVSKFVRQMRVVSKKDFGDERYSYILRQLDGKDAEILDWIVKWLVHQGWEPFAVHPLKGDWRELVYHFKKECSDVIR